MDQRKLRWSELVKDLATVTSMTALGNRVGATQKEVSRWIKGEATPQGEHAEALLNEYTERLGNWKKYQGLDPVYDFRSSFEKNVALGPQGIPSKLQDWPPNIPTTLFGVSLNSPLGVPSSVLTINSHWIKSLTRLGFDIITAKTVRTRQVPAHPLPNAVYLPELREPLKVGGLPRSICGVPDLPDENVATISLANSFGVPSPDPKDWREDLQTALGVLNRGQMLIASVTGTGTASKPGDDLIGDYIKCARLAHEVKPHAIELNLSCPNVYGKEGFVYKDPELSARICKRLRSQISHAKLLLKIGYLNLEQLTRLFNATHRYVDGYTAINALPAKIVSQGQRGEPVFPGADRTDAGISGVAIRDYALETVRSLRRLANEAKRPEIVIIGVGGISSSDDVTRFKDAGANCVQICTAAILNPHVASEIRKQLARAGSAPGRSRILDRSGVSPPFQDPIIAQAFDNLVEACREEQVDLFQSMDILREYWLDGYTAALTAVSQSPGSPDKTRRDPPSKIQIKDWLRRGLKS